MTAKALIALALLAACGDAVAQVAVNPGALDQLRPERTRRSATPSQRTPSTRETRRPAPPQSPAGEHPAAPSAATPLKPGQPAAPVVAAPQVPTAPPNAAVLPPPAVAVPTAPAPLPPVPVADDAPGAAEPLPDGLRITFGKDRSDLNPAAVAAIRQLALQAKAKPGALDVAAYAAGTPDDPSIPRRLSLARALAVRAVLLQEGVESPRIYVRALGANANSDPADRVDLTRQGAATAANATKASGR